MAITAAVVAGTAALTALGAGVGISEHKKRVAKQREEEKKRRELAARSAELNRSAGIQRGLAGGGTLLGTTSGAANLGKSTLLGTG